jgi:MYXO-CTERM domain-containing protein
MCARVMLLTSLLLLFCGALHKRAAACEPGVCHQTILPADGAQDVPLNTRVWLFYSVGGRYTPTLSLKDGNGTVVPSQTNLVARGGLAIIQEKVMVLQPTALLSASTTYTIEVTNAPICDNSGILGDGIVLQTFTTGITTDISPPTFGGAETVTAEFVPETPPNGPCTAGPDRFRYTVTGSAAEAGSIYTLYLDGQNVDMRTTAEAIYEVMGSGEIPLLCFVLHALDQAGNAEGNEKEICFSSSPDEDGSSADGVTDGDGGLDDASSPDGGDGSDGSSTLVSPGGCGCASTGNSLGTAWILLGALLLLRRPRS